MNRILIICIITSNTLFAQTLVRKADRGFSYSLSAPDGVLVTSVQERSAVYDAGLRKGDLLTEVDDSKVNSYYAMNSTLPLLRSGKATKLKVLRNQSPITITITFHPAATETYANTTVNYSSFKSNGVSVRSLTSSPKNKTGKKLPAVMLVQWLSCSSIEVPGEAEDGFDYIIKSFAANPDIIFYRIDKAGVGDSEGTPCVGNDALSEIRTYKDALQALKRHPDVDTSQIYLLGLSLGTSLAPMIGEGENIKGYMVSGGTTVTWLEHMLEVERRRLTLAGSEPAIINQALRSFGSFYDQYLNQKETPAQIMEKNSAYKSIWYDQPAHQYGRPSVYFQQLQEMNFEQSWQQVKVPVLVIYGEYDWLMSRNDHQRIVDIVNKDRSNDLAKLITLPQTSHLLSKFASLQDCFNSKGGVVNKEPYDHFWSWLKPLLK